MKKLQWPEISAMNSETDSVEIFLKNFFIEASKSKTAITARLAEAVLRKVQKNNKRALRKVMRFLITFLNAKKLQYFIVVDNEQIFEIFASTEI